MRRKFLLEDALTSVPTDGYIEVVRALNAPAGRPQFLPLSLLSSLAAIDTFAELDAIVADEALVNVSMIDTLAELNAIVADLNILDTTQLDTIAEVNSLITDATLATQAVQMTPGSAETYFSGAQYTTSVERIGGFIITTIVVGLDGWFSSTTDLDILGKDGPDLAVNGAMAADTDWTYGADWSIAAGVATAAPGAGTTFAPTVPTVIVAGETYRVTYTMSGYVAGALNANIGGTALTARGSDATFVEQVIASDTTDLIFTSDAASDYDIDDVAIVHVGSCHFGRITAAVNGTLYRGEVKCLVAPVGGVTDINIYSAPEVGGFFDDAVTGLTQVELRDNSGAWSAAPDSNCTYIASGCR